jgi:hypothetical protein
MITANFTVYGHQMGEIQDRAKMVARRFFGELEPHLDFEITKVEAMCNGVEHLGLWRADVHAEWPSPYEFKS